MEFLITELSKQSYNEITDFFEYIIQGVQTKWEIIKKYPYIYEFLISAVKEQEKEIKEYIVAKSIDKTKDTWNEIILKSDKNKFKNPDDIDKIANLLRYYSNGLMKEFMETKTTNIEVHREKFLNIISMLKENFYKEEYL